MHINIDNVMSIHSSLHSRSITMSFSVDSSRVIYNNVIQCRLFTCNAEFPGFLLCSGPGVQLSAHIRNTFVLVQFVERDWTLYLHVGYRLYIRRMLLELLFAVSTLQSVRRGRHPVYIHIKQTIKNL